MVGYVLLTDSPFFAVTDASGQYRIDGVPVGHYSVRVWYESLDAQVVQVDVKLGQTSTLDIVL